MTPRTQRAIVCAFVTAVLATALPAWPVDSGQAVEEVFTRDKPIPKGYKTWTLFLVCSPEWLLPQNKDRVTDLYYQFLAFGRSIGQQHAAVWFWIKPPNWATDAVIDNVDVERSVTYCQRLKLAPSGGPYVFFTSTYPDEISDGISDKTVKVTVALNGRSPADITKLLAGWADELVLNGVPKQAAETEGFWRAVQASFEAVQRRVGSLGENVTLSITSPWFKVERKE